MRLRDAPTPLGVVVVVVLHALTGLAQDVEVPEPVEEPVEEPTGEPTGEPTEEPTDEPTDEPGESVPGENGPGHTGPGIDGVLADARSREPIIEGTVQVVGRDVRATSDLDGNYHLDLPPGRYTLRAWCVLYHAVRVERVIVRRTRRTNLDIRLEPDTDALQEVVITARADRATEATQLQVRRDATSVQDTVSAQEMQRAPDSAASDAVRRVVAATVVDGQYLFVRGLGGRYTNVLLNGVPLPSTDPDSPSVQLDIFPAALLTSMSLVKTFTPDLHADFVGGSLNIATREFPEDFKLTLSATLGGGTEATFRNVLGYAGGSLDWLGIDDGSRALPDEVPAQRVEEGRGGITRADTERIGESFENVWNLRRHVALPDFTLGASIGDTVQLGGRDLGYLLAFTYGLSNRRTNERTAKVDVDGLIEQLSQESARERVLWGALGTVGYDLGEESDLTIVALFNRAAENEARFRSGVTDAEDFESLARRLSFVERTIFFTQILGDHRETPIGRLRWQVFGGIAARNEPDTRDVIYIQPPGAPPQWRSAPGSGERFFSTLGQRDFGGATELRIPIDEASVRIGYFARFVDRDFTARRFGHDFIGMSAAERQQSPEAIFGPAGQGTTVVIEELTEPSDGYTATQRQYAAFSMLEVPFLERFRFIAGVRAEAFEQDVQLDSPYAERTASTMVRNVERTDVDLMPAASVVVELVEDMFVRAAYGATLARPQVRELVPFRFQDFVRRRTVEGNPDLQRSYVHNFDVRWEMYPSDTEVLAATFFIKEFSQPIESVLLDRNGNVGFSNIAGASNLGGELEARISLGRISDSLEMFNVGANMALIRSRARFTETSSNDRPIAGQSPYVANLSLGFAPTDSGFSANIYYNVVGPRIVDVGSAGLPDVYEQPLHQVDLSASWEVDDHWSLRFTAKNLLYQEVVLQQGAFDVRRYQPGMSFGVRLGFTN